MVRKLHPGWQRAAEFEEAALLVVVELVAASLRRLNDDIQKPSSPSKAGILDGFKEHESPFKVPD